MNPENDLIAIQTHKEITRLYKTFLELVEDMKNNHNIMLKKVAEKHGPAYAEDINYFTDQYYEQLRKRVLDNGNDCNRQLLAFLEYFDFVINKDKVQKAAAQKRVVKKFVTSSPTLLQ
jgi:hypothetical protein